MTRTQPGSILEHLEVMADSNELQQRRRISCAPSKHGRTITASRSQRSKMAKVESSNEAERSFRVIGTIEVNGQTAEISTDHGSGAPCFSEGKDKPGPDLGFTAEVAPKLDKAAPETSTVMATDQSRRP